MKLFGIEVPFKLVIKDPTRKSMGISDSVKSVYCLECESEIISVPNIVGSSLEDRYYSALMFHYENCKFINRDPYPKRPPNTGPK